MGLMLDTSAVIALVEQRHDGVRRALVEQNQPPTVSVITVGELHHGVEASTNDHQRSMRSRTLQTCLRLEVIGVDGPAALRYGRLSARLPRRIGAADRWIAACAGASGATLVTLDADLAEALAGQRDTAPIWTSVLLAQ